MPTGPSFSGPLTGWTSASVAPKVVAPPPAANVSSFRPQPVGTGPATPFDYRSFEQAEAGADYDNSPEANQARLAKAAAAEAAARASGDPYQLRLAQSMLAGFTAQSTPGDAKAKREAAMAAEKAFIARNPTAVARITPLGDKTGMAGVRAALFGAGGLKQGEIKPIPKAASGDGGSGGGDDALGPDLRAPTKKLTPLESLLSAIYPEEAQMAAADPLADPRAVGKPPSVIETILGNLGANRGTAAGGASGYVPGPAFSGPVSTPVGPSQGANIAATIPGAPSFLAGAINNVQAFNPYNQVPTQPVRGGGGGFDPLIGISAISAEQRIQKAELDKAKAAAQAKYLASQAKQEKMRAEADQLARLKNTSPVGQTGWTPAMPAY